MKRNTIHTNRGEAGGLTVFKKIILARPEGGRRIWHTPTTDNAAKIFFRKAVRGSGGFSLIELMITMVIVSIMMAAMWKVWISSSTMATRQDVAIEAQDGLRAAMNFMAKDIRMAGLAKTTGVAEIEDAETDSIRFTLDRDLDGSIDSNGFGDPDNKPEDITYQVEQSGDQYDLVVILNGDPDTAAVVMENAFFRNAAGDRSPGLTFDYLDINGDVLAAPIDTDDIMSVVIRLATTESDTATYTGKSHVLVRTIRCRNLGIEPGGDFVDD